MSLHAKQNELLLNFKRLLERNILPFLNDFAGNGKQITKKVILQPPLSPAFILELASDFFRYGKPH
jgi:hypothetical protein